MLPQQLQDLAIPPPLGHRPVCGPEVADSLRPLAGGWVALDDVLLVRGACGRGWRARDAGVGVRLGVGVGLELGGPVVDIPVVLVEEEVVLIEEG
jgi:hypothetical protein